ncbi:MAG: hypothetical protein JG765_244 [Cereibacter sp.]|jgi:cell division septation protein DedD|nr:hypothetical protein [Cereibacter sp.]
MARAVIGQLILAAAAAALLSGCAEGIGNPFARDEAEPETASSTPAPASNGRDIEAPEVFQTSDAALWDGRPSLGGVWVASPAAKDPERVILRNPANGRSVIGALFRRERDNPGPTLQISSDAAAALGLLAGQPAEISVTALRRSDAPAAPAAAAPVVTPTPDAPRPAAAPPRPTTPAPAPAAPSGEGLIQIGIFSVEANARRAAETLGEGGVPASVRPETSQDKQIWSVTAGPAADRDALLARVKGLGFSDAYFLSR